MPIEHREISFSLEEIEELIENYGEQFDGAIPSGFLLSIDMKTIPELNENVLALTIRCNDLNNTRVVHELPLCHVSSCLLLHCEDNDIPLPIKAIKTLRVEKNRLILRVTFGKTALSHRRPSARSAA